MIPYQVESVKATENKTIILEEKCDVAKSKEMRFCQLPLCEKCANFEKPCASLNEKCADVDGTMTCLCKSPFVQDDFGDCKNSTKSTTSQQLITKIWVPIVSLVAFALAIVLVVLLMRYFKRIKKSKELTEEKKRRTARIQNLNYDKPYEEKSYETPYKNHIYNEYNPSSEDDRQSVIYETYNSEQNFKIKKKSIMIDGPNPLPTPFRLRNWLRLTRVDGKWNQC